MWGSSRGQSEGGKNLPKNIDRQFDIPVKFFLEPAFSKPTVSRDLGQLKHRSVQQADQFNGNVR